SAALGEGQGMTGAGSAVMRGRLSSLATSAFERPVYFRLWRVSDSANQGNASEIVLSIVHGGAPSFLFQTCCEAGVDLRRCHPGGRVGLFLHHGLQDCRSPAVGRRQPAPTVA